MKPRAYATARMVAGVMSVTGVPGMDVARVCISAFHRSVEGVGTRSTYEQALAAVSALDAAAS